MKQFFQKSMAVLLSLAVAFAILPSAAYAKEAGIPAAEGQESQLAESLEVLQAEAMEASLAAQAADSVSLLASYDFGSGDITGNSISDKSGQGHNATLEGEGAAYANGMLTLPGGKAGSNAAYVTIPGQVFEGQDTLTITLWLKNQTGSGNYTGMFFGSPSKYAGGGTSNAPLHYWLLNPAQPNGYFKSVWTDGDNAGAPYSTETAVSSTKTGSDWAMYTTVITPSRIIGYYNGAEVCNNGKSKTTTDFGKGLVSYIGRSPYNDMFYKGGVYGVRVYAGALTQKQIWDAYYTDTPAEVDGGALLEAGLASAKAALDLGSLSAVTQDLALPTEGANGASIAWSSSKPEVISADGAVHRDLNNDVEVTLTAAISLGSKSDTKAFTATVRKASVENLFQELADNLRIDAIVAGDFALPSVSHAQISVEWSSSDSSVVSISKEGAQTMARVTRPETADAKVTLQVKAAYGEGTGRRQIEKSFPVLVRAKDYGSLMAYTNSKENASLGSSLHLAYSRDGNDYTALNSNTGICFAKNIGGSKNTNPNGLKNVYVFRKADGTYGMVAKNMGSEKYIFVFDSENLVDFTNERKLLVDAAVAGGLQVKAVSYGGEDVRYEVYWTDGSRGYCAVTKDFVSVLEQGPANYAQEDRTVTGASPQGAEVGNLLPVGQAEYERVVQKLGVVSNQEILPVNLEVEPGADTASLFEGRKVTATYNDGSTKEMAVDWSAQDIAAIQSKEPGVYSVSGTVKQTKYVNPFIEQRADPCILKGDDGYYYFTASYPVCGNSENSKGIGYDRVILRRSQTIEGLAEAEEIAVWECKNSPNQFRFIWAPEIHLIKGTYYIFYTASIESNSTWGIRPHVLKCTNPSDIMNPSSWQEMGRMLAKSTDSIAFSDFSLDMTVFENNGHWYVIWAQALTGSSLLMAEINPDNPVECLTDSVLITQPEYAWERQAENVNEGPSVLKSQGKIYVAFSAAGTGPEYCVGLLSIEENADLLDASAWKKQSYPVLTSSDVPGEYGPGHNSFTVDEEGNPIFVYHARTEECYKNQCAWASSSSLYDPCRQARLKRVHFAKDGTPILKMSYAEELAPENQTVKATVTVKGKEEPPIVEPPEVEKITLDKDSLSLTAGKSYTLKAAVSPADAENQELAWSSSDSGIASVDQKGKVTAQKAGKAEITVTSANGKTASCSVTVKAAKPPKIAVKTVKLNKAKATLGVGEKLALKATVKPANATDKKVVWRTDKPSVLSVSNKGLAKAKKTGSAKITATVGGKKAVCKLTVKKAPSKIILSAKPKTLKKGKSFTVKVKLPGNTACSTYKYSTSNKKVASVSASGKVKALKKGKTTITVKAYNGKKAKLKVIVK